MVTRHVGELEQWLGTRLLQRTTRQVTLTDAGVRATSMDDKIAMAIDLEKRVRAGDPRIRQVDSATYSDYEAEAAIASTTRTEPGVVSSKAPRPPPIAIAPNKATSAAAPSWRKNCVEAVAVPRSR